MENHFFSFLSQWFFYLLPTIVFWFRQRAGKKVSGGIGFCFLCNLFLGWTVIVWILMMLNAFGSNAGAGVLYRVAKLFIKEGPGPTGVPQPAGSSSPQVNTCGQCGGTGSMSCSQCQGRGSWYTQPTTAYEASQLQTCGYCMSSGRIRCQYCGGTGHA
jgi:hypothetical protein